MQGAGCRVRFNPRQGSFYLVFACLYKLGEERGRREGERRESEGGGGVCLSL